VCVTGEIDLCYLTHSFSCHKH